MELKPNMYVRTDLGEIGKITSVAKNNVFGDGECVFYNSEPFLRGKEIKTSFNIIDLIEVGDYVNGSKVIDISIIGKNKEKWVWVEQMEDTDNKYGDDYVGYNNDQIKSIVTKEAFESMSYKVGE